MARRDDLLTAPHLTAVASALKAAAGVGLTGGFTAGINFDALVQVWGELTRRVSEAAGEPLGRHEANELARGVLNTVYAFLAEEDLAAGLAGIVPQAAASSTLGVGASINLLFTLKYAQALGARFEDGDATLGTAAALAAELLSAVSISSLAADVDAGWSLAVAAPQRAVSLGVH